MFKLDPPHVGEWTIDGFPEFVDIEGYEFARTDRKQPYPNVVEQYRQTVPRDSMHLLVAEHEGRLVYVIDHVDEFNPDMGHPVRHFLVDHPKGPAVTVVTAGVLGMLGAAAHAGRRKPSEDDSAK